MEKLSHGEMTLDFENRYRCKDGSWKWLSWRAHPFPAEGLMYFSARDMTVRRDVEAKLRQAKVDADSASVAKSNFLAKMSHEIRTPLNSILGYTQLMLRDPALGNEAKENLKVMNQGGEHLLSLINAILDMSKIEAGRAEIRRTSFNVSTLVANLELMFRGRADAKALALDVWLDGEFPNCVVCDEGKVRQVLINLLGNAIKFTERGRINLHVTAERRTAGQLWLVADVEDTGPGLTDEEQGKLFQPFTQIKDRINTGEGTGLGLAISREYAHLLGGDLTVTSRPGQGSIFRLEVPIERGDSQAFDKPGITRRVIGIRAGEERPKILVVDDQLANRDWLMKLLAILGFQVEGAENGEAAIRIWEEWRPQLILMDVHMPVMDGFEATRRIKAAIGGKETVIIALTASALTDQRESAIQNGADDFVSKPFNQHELLEKMRGHLKVAFEYEDGSGNESNPDTGVSPLSAESLAQLPQDLIGELRVAILRGKKKLMDQLILQVHEAGHAESAHALKKLAENYDYPTLNRLLEAACRQ
jgi:signal transduction histidine kinase/CheY-like chemotaxis protein